MKASELGLLTDPQTYMWTISLFSLLNFDVNINLVKMLVSVYNASKALSGTLKASELGWCNDPQMYLWTTCLCPILHVDLKVVLCAQFTFDVKIVMCTLNCDVKIEM